METAKSEMIGNDRAEATEMNKEFDEAKAAEEKAQREAELAEQQRLDAEKSAQEAAEVLEKLKGNTVGVENSVESKSWKDKTWQEIQDAEHQAGLSNEERQKFQNERGEAWHALKDLEGADAEQIAQAKEEAEHEIKLYEQTLNRPTEEPTLIFKATHPDWKERGQRARQEVVKNLEGWGKRLNAIYEVINRKA
jgi:hypothetical protein